MMQHLALIGVFITNTLTKKTIHFNPIKIKTP
jgi:hypothetical protein